MKLTSIDRAFAKLGKVKKEGKEIGNHRNVMINGYRVSYCGYSINSDSTSFIMIYQGEGWDEQRWHFKNIKSATEFITRMSGKVA